MSQRRSRQVRAALVLLIALGGVAVLAASVRSPAASLHASTLQLPAPDPVAVQPASDLSEAFVAISDAVMPAIVRIEADYPAGRRSQRAIPPELREFFNHPDIGEAPRTAGGTGFIIQSDGYVLTNTHVVQGAEAVRVTLFDKRRYDATVIGLDPTTDVALLRIDADSLPTLRLGDSERVRVGEWVVAVGNPGFGGENSLDFTVTSGIISAKGRPLNILEGELETEGGPPTSYAIEDFLQTDAVINPGNSGGPLVNLSGEVIGINTAIASGTGFYQGYGFAIPINLARRVVSDLVEHGRVRRALLGVTIADVSAEDADVYGLPSIAGVLVQDFSSGSPAEEAGLARHDVIVSIDQQPVHRVGQLQRVIAQHHPEETVQVGVIRYGERLVLDVELVEASLSAPMLPEPRVATPGEGLGIELEDLTASLASEYDYPHPGGVVIASVRAGSPAARVGRVVRGQRVLSINRQPVRSARNARERLAALPSGEIASLLLANRDGRTLIANVRVP